MRDASSAITARAVWKSFGGPPALRDISLDVPFGRTLALLGPNGAGKSTLLRLLAGILRPSLGEVLVEGRPSLHPGARRRMGYAGHLSCLYSHLTAIENLRFYAELYALDGHAAARSLEQFDLTAYGEWPVHQLSRGLIQRLSLARALLHDPQILLLDEPFTGLDAAAAVRFKEMLRDVRRQRRAVVVATHTWAEAEEVADEVLVLVQGRMAASEPAQTMTGERLMALYEPQGSGIKGQALLLA